MARVILWFLAMALAAPAAAQDVGADPPGATSACFGFSFGRWEPPLDWVRAGHATPPRMATDAGIATDGGRRSWATDQSDSGLVELVLYPAWWPVGVHVRLLEAGGDTLRGTATALVADGRVAAPVARAAAVRVPCARRPAPRDARADSTARSRPP